MEVDNYELTGKYWTRNFLLMGIPRSGTSLFVKILNKITGIHCFNETWYDVVTLAGFFTNSRLEIMNGRPVENKFDNNGNYTEDTLLEENKQKELVEWSNDLVLGLKANETFLFHINRLIYNTFLCYGLIRHPVYTMGSWNAPKSEGTLNVYNIDTDSRYNDFNLKGNKLEMQAQLWDYYSRSFLSYREHMPVLRYEDWTANPTEALKEFATEFGVVIPQIEPFENMNKDGRYDNLDEIRKVVKKHCKSAKKWGYEI